MEPRLALAWERNMLQFEPETHPCGGHGELEEPSLGGDVKESGKEQTEEGSERLSPNKGLPCTFSLCGPTRGSQAGRVSQPASCRLAGGEGSSLTQQGPQTTLSVRTWV